ncbi:cytochrome P450 [Hypoxylon trugodes]|uniref:cytochrome P450 n=1 Tax=Hypoxylon trugodes TaxID=326681 RepID=UPI0021929C00|nr:cytochrome P450 [Hypoxylon trugodes]KAI1390435.1 cytochrome P450 [Hypoxylon trugodes]
MDILFTESGPSCGALLIAGAKIVSLVVLLTIACICFTYRNRGFWSSSSANSKWIAGPKSKAFKGSVEELRTDGAASCKAWFSLYQRYGPAYEMTIPFFRLHIINHPTYLEHIQKHNSKNYIRGAFARNVFQTLHRSSIFISDGQAWQLQRKAATKAFSKQNFEQHITRSLHYWLDVLMRLLSNLAKEQQEFDFQELMGRMMFCLFLRIAFHEEKMALEILSENPQCLKSMPAYVKAFDEANYLFDRRRRDPLWKISERLSGEDKISQRAVDLFYGQIDGLIKRRLDAMEQGYKPNPEAGVDLLDLFLQSTKDLYTLGGMVFAFLSAGRDTTAYSISWLMKEIHHKDNKHLDAANKIRAEAEELGFTNDFLSYGDAPRLRFANAMWDETARLNTVSPAGQMEAAGDDTLPAVPELNMPPRHIKKGDIVSYQNYVLSRMPQVWGDDAAVFNPSRWFKDNGESISYSAFKYHSWNAGPRSCLGRALATYEGIAISTAILQRFDVILSDTTKTYEPLAALNMGIKGGLPMRVRVRASVRS